MTPAPDPKPSDFIQRFFHRPSCAERNRSLAIFALMYAIVEWGDNPVSHRKLRKSDALKDARELLGLDSEPPSVSTIGNHLKFLAGILNVTRITKFDEGQQDSEFEDGVWDAIRRLCEVLPEEIAPILKQRRAQC